MSETRLAIISIIITDRTKSAQINALLSEFGEFIVGRMGIPYRERNLSVMCIVADAPQETLNKLTGKIGMIEGVTAKTLMTKQ